MLLIAGGELDPNIACLLQAARRLRRSCTALLVGPNRHPTLSWEIKSDHLILDRRVIRPKAAFIRHDVFGHMDDERNETAHRAYAWFSTVASYVESHNEIRSFNRRHEGGTKPHQLLVARRVGLDIPWTLVTNDVSRLRVETQRQLVVKPINGGEYCQRLRDVLPTTQVRKQAASAPAIVQEELVQPDIRIYRIGNSYLAFNIASQALDYRSTSEVCVTPIPRIGEEIRAGLERLMDELGLDFGAADFKADAETGQLRFLEVNSAPMFVAFDVAAKGLLTKAILDHLAGRAVESARLRQ